MLVLLQTLVDIIRLRKGPDVIPYSWILCSVTLLLWLAAGLLIARSTEGMNDQDFLYGTLTGVAGLACYAAVIVSSGRTPRLLQTVTAILGCGAIISFLFLATNVLLGKLLGNATASLIATFILLWSIPVEGHIVARAIDKHWYVGVVLAMAVFIFQVYLYAFLNPNPMT